ncbi:MAG TPA: hypothetical protein VN644_14845, partial [Pyrinomonadaceae bacterium]|nr:hypothetical protein [Pyrinomonadaceae bacterium]
LERSKALPADRIASLRQAIQSAEHSNDGAALAKLKELAPSLDESAGTTQSADATRMHALAEILRNPAR